MTQEVGKGRAKLDLYKIDKHLHKCLTVFFITVSKGTFNNIGASSYRWEAGIMEKLIVTPFVAMSILKPVFFFIQTYGALFCETSAKEGSNIVEAVLHLAR